MEITLKNKFPSALAIIAAIVIIIPAVAILDFCDFFNRPLLQPLHADAVPFLILLVILSFLSRIVFRSDRSTLFKAIYTALPITIVLYYIFVDNVFGWSILPSVLFIGLFIAGVLAYLSLKKKPWQYKFSVISTTAVLFTSYFAWLMCNGIFQI